MSKTPKIFYVAWAVLACVFIANFGWMGLGASLVYLAILLMPPF